MPEADAYRHIWNWITFLQLQYYDGKALAPNFPLFPSFNLHNIHWGSMLSTASVNELLELYAKAAGLNTLGLTSHCFRCGGVQYWLLHAPTVEQWSLERCCWWGGWAAGEDVSVSPPLSKNNTLNLQYSVSQIPSSNMPLMLFRITKLITVMHWPQSRLIIGDLLVVLLLTPRQ